MAEFVTNKELQEYLKKIDDAGNDRGRRIEKIDRNLESIAKWRVRTEETLHKHDHTLYGNGEPGMDEVLRNVNLWIDEQKVKEKEYWSDTKKFTLGVVAYIVNQLLTIWLLRMFGG